MENVVLKNVLSIVSYSRVGYGMNRIVCRIGSWVWGRLVRVLGILPKNKTHVHSIHGDATLPKTVRLTGSNGEKIVRVVGFRHLANRQIVLIVFL